LDLHLEKWDTEQMTWLFRMAPARHATHTMGLPCAPYALRMSKGLGNFNICATCGNKKTAP
jgi:hypothetical protein